MNYKHIVAALVALTLVASGIGMAVSVSTDIGDVELNGYSVNDDGNLTEQTNGSVTVDNGTVVVLNSTDTVRTDVTLSDPLNTSERVMFVGDNEAVYAVDLTNDSDGTVDTNKKSGGDTIVNVSSDGAENITLDVELQDSFQTGDNVSNAYQLKIVNTANGEVVNATTNWDVEVEAGGGGFGGGTIGNLPVPSFFTDFFGEDIGTFLFYGMAVGVVILGGVALWFVYNRNMSKGKAATAYAALSLGSIGSLLTTSINIPVIGQVSAWIIVVAFIALAIVVGYLYTTQTETMNSDAGTMYVN